MEEELEKPTTVKIGDDNLMVQVVDVLLDCYDPEIPVDIYNLGLIYEIKIDDEAHVFLKMTLTSPMCPVAGSLPGEIETKIKALNDIKDCTVELVWEPTWTQDMMAEDAKLKLNLL